MKPYWSYLKSLLRHKWFVLLAGLKVGGVPLWRLIVHDMSKFSRFEFRQYAVKFHGQESPVDADQVSLDFAYAWLHHENSNPHHWGYWIPRSGKYAGKPLPMPHTYVREMVADWMGAGRTYQGHWDMTKWLNENLYRMNEHWHETTKVRVGFLLDQQGYRAVYEEFLFGLTEETYYECGACFTEYDAPGRCPECGYTIFEQKRPRVGG